MKEVGLSADVENNELDCDYAGCQDHGQQRVFVISAGHNMYTVLCDGCLVAMQRLGLKVYDLELSNRSIKCQ